MTTRATAPTDIIYPDTDGMPLPDGEYQSPIFRRTLSPLDIRYENMPGAHMNGDTFIYYVEGDPRRSVSPDCYVALDRSPEELESIRRNNVYLMWEMGGPPDFVLEIASHSTARVDLGGKRDLYAEIGVSEYWRYDETGGDFYGEPLVGERLADGEYRRLEMHVEDDGRVWGHSDALNLDLWWIDGELKYWDPVAGEWLLNYWEAHNALLAETDRADTEQRRAELERERADEAEAQLARMQAELRRLRGEE